MPRHLRAKIQLENFCCYLNWTCFAVDLEKALFSSLFNFLYIWRQLYFLSFLLFRLNNPYLFNIFSQIDHSFVLLWNLSGCSESFSSCCAPNEREAFSSVEKNKRTTLYSLQIIQLSIHPSTSFMKVCCCLMCNLQSTYHLQFRPVALSILPHLRLYKRLLLYKHRSYYSSSVSLLVILWTKFLK